LSDKSPLLAIVAARALFGGAAILGLLALVAVLIRPLMVRKSWRTIAAAAAAGAAFHGILGITAIVELGLTRYLVPVWPIVGTLAGLGSVLLLNALAQREPAPAGSAA